MIPKVYEDIKKQMSELLCTYDFNNDIFEPSVAYTYTIQSVFGLMNEIHVNNKDTELAKFLFVHEAGHIIFGHTRDLNERLDNYLYDNLQAAYKKIEKYFGYRWNNFFNYFKNSLLNIVMDFEVNSRLFSAEEMNFINSRMLLLLQDPEAKGLWPEDFGFPVGKTWDEYLNIIFLDPAKFFEKLHEMLKTIQHLKKYFRSSFNGVLTPAEYRRIRDECRYNKYFSEEDKDMLRRLSNKHSESNFGIPTGTMSGCSTDDVESCVIKFTSYVSMPDLVEKMKRILFTNKNGFTLRNQMYNTNRRKHNSNVIIPKTVKYVQSKKPDLFLLFDVSGSIDSESVNNFLETFRKFKDEFKKTKIIFWTTHLVSETSIEDPVPHLYGGGTEIASGIKYTNEKYKLNSRDVFFVISDFCDSLHAWQQELSKISCRKLAIDWSSSSLRFNPGFERILKNGQDNDIF